MSVKRWQNLQSSLGKIEILPNWCESFVQAQGFHRVSGDSLETTAKTAFTLYFMQCGPEKFDSCFCLISDHYCQYFFYTGKTGH